MDKNPKLEELFQRLRGIDDSMQYAPPEGRYVWQTLAADACNEIARLFGLRLPRERG